MEITSVSDSDSDFSSSAEEEREPPTWVLIGQLSLLAFSTCAVSAFIPASLRKRRVHSLVLPSLPIPVAVEAPPAEEPQERPRAAQELRLPPAVPSCSTEDAQKIRAIFTTVATEGVLTLWTKRGDLDALGNALRRNRVHPFEFLKQAPRQHVQTIMNSYNPFKIMGVMSGVNEGMEREKAVGNLEPYIPAFARDMHKDAERIRQLIRAADWRGTVNYLFDIPS